MSGVNAKIVGGKAAWRGPDMMKSDEWGYRLSPAHRAEFDKLDGYERIELLELLSSCDPREFAGLAEQATTAALKAL